MTQAELRLIARFWAWPAPLRAKVKAWLDTIGTGHGAPLGLTRRERPRFRRWWNQFLKLSRP